MLEFRAIRDVAFASERAAFVDTVGTDAVREILTSTPKAIPSTTNDEPAITSYAMAPLDTSFGTDLTAVMQHKRWRRLWLLRLKSLWLLLG